MTTHHQSAGKLRACSASTLWETKNCTLCDFLIRPFLKSLTCLTQPWCHSKEKMKHKDTRPCCCPPGPGREPNYQFL